MPSRIKDEIFNNRFVAGAGPKDARIVLVGQNPGAEEDKAGVPFVGPAGQLLDRMLVSAGLSRDSVFVTNAVQYRTPFNREPTLREITKCKPYLMQELQEVKPNVIVAMGNPALKSLTGRGQVSRRQNCLERLPEGFGLPDVWVLPCYHPVFSMHQERAQADIIKTLARAKRLSEGGGVLQCPSVQHWPTMDSITLPGLLDIRSAEWVTFDFETNGYPINDSRFKVLLLGVATENGVYVAGPDPTVIETVYASLEVRCKVRWKTAGHNSTRFDTRILDHFHPHHFLHQEHEWWMERVDDTLELAYATNENLGSYSLESLGQTLLSVEPWKDMVSWDWHDEENIPWETAIEYCGRDCYVTLLLYKLLYPQVLADEGLCRAYEKVLRPSSYALQTLEEKGVYIDRGVLFRLEEENSHKVEAFLEWCKKLGVNPNSPKQLADLIYHQLCFAVPKFTKTGEPSTDEFSLKKLLTENWQYVNGENFWGKEFVQSLLEYRKAAKQLSTYIRPYLAMTEKEPRIYPGYSTTRTVTWRTASFAPEGEDEKKGTNIQNVPRVGGMRSAITVPEGHVIIGADYSQLELRILAHEAREENLTRILLAGQDPHLSLAQKILGRSIITDDERVKYGKTPNFSLAYCATTQTFMDKAFKEGIVYTYDEADEVRNLFHQAYPGLDAFYADTAQKLQRDGYIRSFLGAYRRLPAIYSKNQGDREEALRQAINFRIQNPASMIANRSCYELVRLGFDVFMFIHDANYIDCEEWGPGGKGPAPNFEVKDIMERYIWGWLQQMQVRLAVPLIADVKVGKTWADLH